MMVSNTVSGTPSFLPLLSSAVRPSQRASAIAEARVRGLVVIGLTVEGGGKMNALCDICLCAPSNSTPHIQECHLIMEHAVCAGIEQALFGAQRPQ